MKNRPMLILSNMGFLSVQYFILLLGWIFCGCAMGSLSIYRNIYLFLRGEINGVPMLAVLRAV